MPIKLSPAALQKLQTDTKGKREELQALIQEVDKAVANPGWTGPAAESFQNLWNSQYKKTLNDLHTQLAQVLQELKKHEGVAIDVGKTFSGQ